MEYTPFQNLGASDGDGKPQPLTVFLQANAGIAYQVLAEGIRVEPDLSPQDCVAPLLAYTGACVLQEWAEWFAQNHEGPPALSTGYFDLYNRFRKDAKKIHYLSRSAKPRPQMLSLDAITEDAQQRLLSAHSDPDWLELQSAPEDHWADASAPTSPIAKLCHLLRALDSFFHGKPWWPGVRLILCCYWIRQKKFLTVSQAKDTVVAGFGPQLDATLAQAPWDKTEWEKQEEVRAAIRKAKGQKGGKSNGSHRREDYDRKAQILRQNLGDLPAALREDVEALLAPPRKKKGKEAASEDS